VKKGQKPDNEKIENCAIENATT